MKKLFFMAVAAIAALSSCTSDNELELNKTTGKEALTFTATIEDSEATRVTFDNEKSQAVWEVGDQISINGKTYSAQEAGTTSTFTAVGDGATGDTYTAYFPASLYNGTKATLPAIQTYEAGKFNMPMYATSDNTTLAFKNLCAVLAITVTSADIATLKSIKVASDQMMNGSFTVTDNKAVMGTDGTNAVVLESSTALTLDADGTTFYIAIPAQDYKYLNIFLSADGTTYTQAMATKKATGLGTIARSTMFNIDYAKNATKLWEGNLFIADCNVGATSATDIGSNMTFTEATTTSYWGSNWRTPSKEDELDELLKAATSAGSTKVICEYTTENEVYGFKFTGNETGYTGNSVFFPALSGDSSSGSAGYWSGTASGSYAWYMDLYYNTGYWYSDWYEERQVNKILVRPVLEEAASPAPAAPEYPEGSRGTAEMTGGTSVNWVQLWENGPKFAEYNVGVTDGKAESYGGYYCWGNPNDQSVDWTGEEGKDDIATALWGSNWRMPTSDEANAILKNCTFTWTTQNSVNGMLITGKDNYACNSVFIPASGRYRNGSIGNKDYSGSFWTSTIDNTDLTCAYTLTLASSSHQIDSNELVNAYSVRAVLKETPATRGTAKATIGGSDVDVNWVQLWKDGPKFAEYNVADQMSFEDAAKTGADYVWGANWRTPSKEDELDELLLAAQGDSNAKVTCVYGEVGGVFGFTFTGKGEGYTGNSVFFPANGYESFGMADYWSGTEYAENTENGYAMTLLYDEGSYNGRCSDQDKGGSYLVRPVLAK